METMERGLRFRPGRQPAISRFLRDENGATAIEYAMIAAGVGAAVASAVYGLGTSVQTTLYNRIANIFS